MPFTGCKICGCIGCHPDEVLARKQGIRLKPRRHPGRDDRFPDRERDRRGGDRRFPPGPPPPMGLPPPPFYPHYPPPSDFRGEPLPPHFFPPPSAREFREFREGGGRDDRGGSRSHKDSRDYRGDPYSRDPFPRDPYGVPPVPFGVPRDQPYPVPRDPYGLPPPHDP